MEKILFLINTKFNVLRRRAFLEGLSKKYKVVIVCPADNQIEEVQSCKYHYVNSFKGGSSNPFRDINYFIELWRITKIYQPRLILAFTIKPIIYAGFLNNKITKIGTLTGLGYSFEKTDLKAVIARTLFKLSIHQYDRIIVQNKSDKDLLKMIISKPPITIAPGSGVDFNNFIKPNLERDTSRNILMIGRLINAKGFRLLLNNRDELQNFLISNNLYLQIVGDYDESNPDSIDISELKALRGIKNLSLITNHVDVNEFYQNTDILINLSSREGLNRVILESMYFGCSVITLKNPGCFEMIKEGSFNLVMEEFSFKEIKDFCNLFYSKNLQFIENHRMQNQLHIINNYSAEIVLNLYKNLLKDI